MATEDDSNGSAVHNKKRTTDFMQSDDAATDPKGLIVSARCVELEARYQQLLEQRIAALEQRLAPTEGPSEAETPTITSRRELKAAKDKRSNTHISKEEHDLGCKVGSKSRGRKTLMIFDELDCAWKPETPKADEQAAKEVQRDPAPGTLYDFKFIEYYHKRTVRIYSHSEIEILSKGLITILKETLGEEHGPIWREAEGSLRSPYKPIVYSWDKLVKQTVAFAGPQDLDQDREDIIAREGSEGLADMLECIRTSKELKDYFKNRESNIARHVTSYKYLWTLFPPATKVTASPFLGIPQLFLFDGLTEIDKSRYERTPFERSPYERNPYERSRYDDEDCWRVTCICLDFDRRFSPHSVTFEITKFENTKPITALDCYPTRFMDREEEFLKYRVEQGKKFKTFSFNLKGAAKLFYYRGPAISSGMGLNMAHYSLLYAPPKRSVSEKSKSIRSTSFVSDSSDPMGTPQGSNVQGKNIIHVKGQVIVDYRAWNHWGPGDDFANLGDATAEIVDASTWLASTVRKHNLHSIASKAFEVRCKEGDLLDDEYALLPPRLLGYIPVNKKFAQLCVGWLLPVEDKNKDQVWNSDLILDEDKKKIIRTLVENHAQRADKRTPDLVEGKGNGLVILLHGPPGVGKSLTAECVAKATSKPLFTVGLADIGTDSGTVEDRLNKLFSLAAEWDAVLLFDEADVFMEQRGSTDSTLERNALVSVLLRVLKYYEGILILTTNRVLSFDVAVQSRIHLAVMFHDLDENQTRSIIQVHLEKRLHKVPEAMINLFVGRAVGASLNGRQIRNVISAAEAMVNRRESKVITWDDITSVLDHTKEFQSSLQEYSRQQRANNEAQSWKRGK